jgi:hypothetical protein
MDHGGCTVLCSTLEVHVQLLTLLSLAQAKVCFTVNINSVAVVMNVFFTL